MRIQHNIAALNSYRQLAGNNNAVAKNLEKLSSGYKINRAGDDAAGLAISEKMRAQITGLETAQKNANDGISLVQTAEGALTEVHSMLNRMTELATQSANGTYDDSVDRANLQKELDALMDEVDRISEATNFNGINLLDGSLGGAKVSTTTGTASADSIDAVAGSAGSASLGTTSITTPGVGDVTEGDGTGGDFASFSYDLTGVDITIAEGETGAKASVTLAGQAIEIDVDENMDAAALADALAAKITEDGGLAWTTSGGTDMTFSVSASNGKLTFTTTDDVDTASGTEIAGLADAAISVTAGTVGGTPAVDRVNGEASKAELDLDGRVGADLIGGSVKIGDTTYSFVENAADAKANTTAVVLAKESTATEIAEALANANAGTDVTMSASGSKVTVTEVGEDSTKDAGSKNFSGKDISIKFEGTGLRLQVGDTAKEFNKLTVSVGDMSTEGLGLTGISIINQSAAADAIDKIKTAINTVSSTRGDLGAIQNRLEHTINNLGVTTENITAAESRIRDTDMAEEMMAYTKNNILVQAAQAMLAQANQLPQGVLQLLQ